MSILEKAMRTKKWQACARALMTIDKLLTLSDAAGAWRGGAPCAMQ